MDYTPKVHTKEKIMATGLPTNLFEEQPTNTVPAALSAEEEPQRKPGFPKGQKNPRKGSPRARITDMDARLLAFAGKFPCADAEAFSVLTFRQEGPTSEAGGLPAIASLKQRLRKLEKLGAVKSFRHAATGVISYGLTKDGAAYARDFGYNMDHWRGIEGISLERLTHFRMIANVAAQLASPVGFFAESLGIAPVPLDKLISENAMRGEYSPIAERLKAEAKDGKSASYAKWRARAVDHAFKEVDAGKYEWSDLVEAHPVLLTLPRAQTNGQKKPKQIYQPDLTVNLDHDREDSRGRNLLVEIELSKKNWAAYDELLRTIDQETREGIVYNQAVYFTVGTQVGTLLKKIDQAGNGGQGYGLFKSKRLAVLPITHRDGTPVQLHRRISL